MAQRAWQQGHEVIASGKVLKVTSSQTKFPKMVGVLEENASTYGSYLSLSPSKGLKNAVPHQLFWFPLGRNQATFMKNNRSIVWVRSPRSQLGRLEQWIRQQKKKAVFVPLSQFYSTEQNGSKKGVVMNLKRLKALRPHLA